jgi:hypothetical protein
MVRFGLSLVVASLLAFSGFSALGIGANTAAPLKIIAVVTAHAHHSAVSTLRDHQNTPVVQ